MQRLKSALTAVTIGIVLLTALDWAASAATGRAFILGRFNTADHATVLKNGKNGPALDLRSKKGAALAVNNGNRVKHLNADKLDGKDSKDLATTRNLVFHYAATNRAGGFNQNLPAQAPGSYLASYDVQMNGAAGDQNNPNIINCAIVQYGLSGVTYYVKRVTGETTLTSVGTPPSLSGVGPVELASGDIVQLRCTMTRTAQVWSSTAVEPITVTLTRADGTDVSVAPLGRVATLQRSSDR